MQIILLSGGSGQRLWPLSNDTRSKQFLRLLTSPSGEPESMLQRVVRQLNEAQIDAPITVATSASQKDVIQNQLGSNINIVTEPHRRDTFPAIALAVTFLRFVKKCDYSEPVIVMPCDAYTEAGYFHTIISMAHAVERNAADLVLMGICPSAPSPKFGYVVPVKEDAGKAIERVAHFVEKPDEEKAGKLIGEGALWNGGVFAFRLGYLLKIVDNYLKVNAFDEMQKRYGELPKISFDYEVAEKATSVAVLPFKGEWNDLGAWDTLSEKLSDENLGNVTTDENCCNTHIVNELDIPILCVGAKNLMVAASPDGILVVDKNSCEQIKDYVDRLSVRPMYEERRWGVYKVVDHISFPDGHQALTKQLKINAGSNISYQVHRHRDEVWTFIEGTGTLVLDGKVREVHGGEVVYIQKGQMHAIRAVTDLYFIEVQTGDQLVEEDIERFDWKWE